MNYKEINSKIKLFDVDEYGNLDVYCLMKLSTFKKSIIEKTNKAVKVIYAEAYNGYGVSCWIPRSVILVDRNKNVYIPSWVASKILHIEPSLNKYVDAFSGFESYEDEDTDDNGNNNKNYSKRATINKEDDIF